MKQFNLEDIIRARLKLQSTQRALESQFNLSDVNFEYISNPNFIKRFNNWSKDKKKNFIYVLVGKVNMAKTFKLFEELKEKYKNPV
jgi:hypothetical protein